MHTLIFYCVCCGVSNLKIICFVNCIEGESLIGIFPFSPVQSVFLLFESGAPCPP